MNTTPSDFTQSVTRMLSASGAAVKSVTINGFQVLECRSGNRQVRVLLLNPTAKTMEEASRQSALAREILLQEGPSQTIAIVRDRWENQRQITTLRLLSHLGIFDGIFARNCEVRRIEKPVAQEFMAKYHSYGPASCRYCYGLFVKRYSGAEMFAQNHPYPIGTLIAVAEFSNARRWKKEEGEIRSYEWIRYASLPELRISGGMGKILQQFIKDVKPDDIMSYADLEWSDGAVYRQLGFVQDGVKEPVLFEIDPVTWKRTAVKNAEAPSVDGGAAFDCPKSPKTYFQNFGSIKYRLRPSF